MPYHRGLYNCSESQNNSASMQRGNKNKQPGQPQMSTNTRGLQRGGVDEDTRLDALPALPIEMQMPSTVSSTYYTAGFLKQFLGRNMRVEFLIGTTGALVDRVGVLVEVGASYIVLQPYLTDDMLMCDLYSIKFVNIYGPGGSVV